MLPGKMHTDRVVALRKMPANSRRTVRPSGLLALLFSFILPISAALSQDLDLTSLSLEELLEIQVALISRTPEKLGNVPAAVYALTAEDLRRAGVRSLPDALRLVPGVQVARVDANKWAITARGFNNQFANKLLVLIDGRSVYSPLFSGVFWEAQDVLVEDVERIEVIRGPGGTLWGTNAVNGIINVVTRSARDTEGTLAQAGGGFPQTGWAAVRHGRSLGEWGAYRLYLRHSTWPASIDSSNRHQVDDWRISRAGGRLDLSLSRRDDLTLQTDLYTGEVGQTFQLVSSLEPPSEDTFDAESPIRGASVLARWQRHTSADADLAVQLYFDRAERRGGPLEGSIQLLDADLQHRRRYRRHELVWGLNYRRSADSFVGSLPLSFQPPERTTHLWSAFVHEAIDLRPERLRLSLGTKFEHNSHTGLEVQPGARLWWRPATAHALWLAVTRAVRTPSRSDDDARFITQIFPPDQLFPGSPPAVVESRGNRRIVSEKLLAYEAGYRVRPAETVNLDLALFYHIYDDLRSNELGLPEPYGTSFLVPIRADNLTRGRTYGAELAADWQLLPRWQLRASYAYLEMDLKLQQKGQDLLSLSQEEENPHHQIVLRSHAELSSRLQLDLTGRYVGPLPAQAIPSYLALDLHLSWMPVETLELSLVGRDLFANPHPEFAPQIVATLPTWVEASLLAELTCRF
jgi:iron complex outermembrane recepter protein